MELLYSARRCALCRGGGHEELRQERESLFVQWLSCAEEGLHCGHQSSAGDVSDRPEVTQTASVGLSPKLQFAAMPCVQVADVCAQECLLGSREWSQLIPLFDQCRKCLGSVNICSRL